MNVRMFPVYVFVLALCVSFVGFVSIPSGLMSSWVLAMVAFNLLVAVANILVAYWVCEDSGVLDLMRSSDSAIYKRIDSLEGVVDDNFDIVDNRLKKLEQEQNGRVK